MEKNNQNQASVNNDQSKSAIIRPPVVVIMGHVDSGKTSLLDVIRKTNVAGGESGGITQHIGAYQVEKNGKKITFLDTPGHEAFSQMRLRGAKIADIAILVIDACQGVQPQTKEAISHIKKADIHLIVALNKIDRPEANPEKVKGELKKEDILVESLGGKIPSINVSTKTGQGIEEVLEMILLIAEMENLKADTEKPAGGIIIESYLDPQRGPIAILLLQEGIIKVGDIIGTSSVFGKIKGLEDFKGKLIEETLPSDPVIVLGFESMPGIGEIFGIFPDTESAKNNLKILEKKQIGLLPEISSEQKILNLILKTDVAGSIEAIENILKELPQEKVILRILKSGAGEINESDIKLATVNRAIILGFRVKSKPVVKSVAEKEKIRILNFEIIYDLVEGVRKFMEMIVVSEITRKESGKIKILANFLIDKNRQIIGGKVIEGEARRGTSIEVIRGEEIVGRGRLINLQKNKKDVEKAIKGEECGMLFEGDVKIQEGDILAFYTEERTKEL